MKFQTETLPDFETAESHIVEVEVRDAGGDFLEMMEFTIAVADVNEAPDFDLPVTTLNELSPNGTVVGTLDLVEDAADIDPPTVTLMDDAGGRFELVLVAGEYQLRVARWCRKVGGESESWRKLLVVKP